MKSDLEIARYNTSKKLSQLNKVIQYLSYHLEDRIFQVLTIKKKYEEQEMEIINGIDDKIRPIFENLNESRIEIEEQTNKFYQNKLSTMRAALDARSKAAFNDVQNKLHEFEKEIGNCYNTLELINSSLEEQISILKDNKKFDITSIKLRITQMNKDHQLEMKKRDGESKRKIKSIEDEFQKKASELELQHKNNIDQIKTNTSLKTPSIPVNLKQPFINSKERIKSLKKFIQEHANELNQQKIFFQQNMTAFKERFKIIISDYPKVGNMNMDAIEKVRNENEQKYLKMQKRIESLRSELDFKKQNYENDLKMLENQLKKEQGTINSRKEEKEKSMKASKKKNDNELFTFIQSLNDERNKLKLKNQKQINKQEEIMKKIQWAIDHFDEEHSNEFVLLNEEKESHHIEFFQEDKKFKIDFQNRIYNEVKKFNDLKNKYEEQIKHSSSESIEFTKRDDEYKKLKIVLETLNRSIESNMKNLSKSIDDDLSKFKKEKNQESTKANLKLNCNFEVAEHKKKVDINAYQKEIDDEYNKKKNESDKNIEKLMDQIQTEFSHQKEIELNELNNEYEKQYNSMENELNSIVIPSEITELTDQSINDLKNKLENLPNDVIEERKSIIANYEHNIDDEEERHRQLLLAYLAYCNESQERDYESFLKDQKNQISLFEKTIQKLNKELSQIVNISVSLKKFGDSDDLEQIRLEEELSKTREEMRSRIRKEEKIKNEIIKEATEKILKQEEENEKKIKEEREKEKIDSNESHNLFEVQRNRRKKISEDSIKFLNNEQNEFKNLIEKTKNENYEILTEIKRSIINMRHKIENEDELFEERLRKDRRRLEKENNNLIENFPNQLKLFKNGIDQMYPELDKKIEEMKKKRDDAKYAFINKPMRREEATIIKRLEGQLNTTTSHLTTLGRDLLQYRQQLIHQEGEYNVRFGADRSVAVMKPSKRRPTTTMASKRLPKLLNFDSTQNSF